MSEGRQSRLTVALLFSIYMDVQMQYVSKLTNVRCVSREQNLP